MAKVVERLIPAPQAEPRVTWSSLATHIKAIHLNGGSKTLTIKAIKREFTRGQDGAEREVHVLAFREVTQTLILNETCKDALFHLFGNDIQACVGKRIEVYAKPFGKRRMVAIRTAAATPATEPATLGDDGKPF